MPRSLALIVSTVLVFVLLYFDNRKNREISRALWIPVVWFLILGSRPVSLWIGGGKPIVSAADYLEGSPADRNIFLLLMLIGAFILFRRRPGLKEFTTRNKWLLAMILFGGISVLWSEFPFVALKRWTKGIGSLIMVVIVLSEQNKTEAVSALMNRWIGVLVPYSIVLIKYFPEYGRTYSRWSGKVAYTGVTTNKNALGALCMVAAIYLVWDMLRRRKNHDTATAVERFFLIIQSVMVVWLLILANSATSLVTCLVGLAVLVSLGNEKVNRSPHVYLCLFAVLSMALLFSMDYYQLFFAALGRSTDMTGRTELWKQLLSFHINPFLGTGYDSFWLGKRATFFWKLYFWHPNQAHNGYLEAYINLGIVGLFLLLGFAFKSYRYLVSDLSGRFTLTQFRLTILIVILIHNVTEASFYKAMHPLWFMMLLTGVRTAGSIPTHFKPLQQSGEKY